MLLRKYGLPLLATLGLLLGLAAIIMSAWKPSTPPIAFPPPKPPYEHYIAGQGVAEASSENIQIGTPFNEICTDVYVTAGDSVKAGDPLFIIDVETLEAELYQAEIDRDYAIVEYENQQQQLDLYNSLTDPRAVSVNEYNQVFYAAEAAAVAIEQAEARILTIQTNIDRSTIRAPMDGRVLQVNIRPGESANINPFSNLALVVFGPVCPLHLRISVDEDDAWRFKKESPGVAFVRGNSSLCYPIRYVRTEPLLIPKQSLTGGTTERVDTRVLQVIYEFVNCKEMPIYVGQLLDVYIESIPANTRYENEKKGCR